MYYAESSLAGIALVAGRCSRVGCLLYFTVLYYYIASVYEASVVKGMHDVGSPPPRGVEAWA